MSPRDFRSTPSRVIVARRRLADPQHFTYFVKLYPRLTQPLPGSPPSLPEGPPTF